MRTLCLSFVAGLVILAVAGPAVAQNYPGDRTTTNNTRRNQRQPKQTTRTQGPTRAPEESKDALPENRQPIPDPETTTDDPPPTIDDPGFAKAMRTAVEGIVRINMPDSRRALGFLIDGPDEDHKLVVTNFLAVAKTDPNKHFWIDIRLNDWSKLDVVGLYNFDELQDLALIKVKTPKSRKVRILKLAKEDPRKGDKVYAIGYWRTLVDWAAGGVIKKIVPGADVAAPYGSRWLQTDAIITENNVGGPLMDRHGNVVGVCTSYGRRRRGPHVSVPVSAIRSLIDRESVGSGRFPMPEGAFRWPESKDKAKRTQTYSFSRIQAAAMAIKRSLDCDTCNGFGYLVTPQYEVDRNTGRRRKTGEKSETCDQCGGAGVVLEPNLHGLLSQVTLFLLNPDEKIDDGQKEKLSVTAQEGFDRAAVNRKLLVDALMPAANRILPEWRKHIGEPVTFVATQGPVMGDRKMPLQWVRPYGSDLWVMTRGASVRNVTGQTGPPPPKDPRQRRRWQRDRRRRRNSSYVLVSGIIQGEATMEFNKKIHRGPLLKVSDIIILRP
ncbi:MAG: trypsin-like serine protease [Anaerolineaceae bacterium]|nr:trypsin-like serine protease [Anaerolineaceae bacterium]